MPEDQKKVSPEQAEIQRETAAANAPKPIANIAKPRLNLFDSIGVQERIDFARHLAIIVKAGLPINEGLGIIKKQTKSPTLKKVIEGVMVDINNGRFLADALAQYDKLFGGFFINIIRVGESSGTLAQNLLYLSDELRKSKALSSKVKGAMVYPMVIMVATVGVVGFLTFFVFPKLLPVLKGMNVQLPPTTIALIAAVDFLKAWGFFVLIGMVVFFFALRAAVKNIYPVRYIIHMIILWTPAVGILSVTINMTNFSRVLGLLLKSGVKIVEALGITANTFTNEVFKRAVFQAIEEIRKGGQLANHLERHPHLFPPLLTGMVRVGENTGNLEENLSYLSEHFEDEVDGKLRGMTSLLEPVMLLMMGGLVGFVAISIITPIYKISQGVK
jgi:type IV pilus assembly protein PilC